MISIVIKNLVMNGRGLTPFATGVLRLVCPAESHNWHTGQLSLTSPFLVLTFLSRGISQWSIVADVMMGYSRFSSPLTVTVNVVVYSLKGLCNTYYLLNAQLIQNIKVILKRYLCQQRLKLVWAIISYLQIIHWVQKHSTLHVNYYYLHTSVYIG